MAVAWRSSVRDTRVNWGQSAPSVVSGVAPTITTTAAADGAVGEAYVQLLLATGDAPIVWSVDTGGTLPVWLSIDEDRLAGVPLEPGLHEFTLTATNDYGSDTQALSILVPNEMSGGGEIDTDVVVLAPPTGVTASAVTKSTATLSLTDTNAGGAGYRWQTAASPFSSWATASGSPTAAGVTSLAVSGLAAGVTYKARAAATAGGVDSVWVESGEFTMTALSAPSTPAVANIGHTTALASWTDNETLESGYRVEIAASPFSSWAAISGSPFPENTGARPLTGLTPETEYRVRVAATNGATNSAWATSASFTTSAVPAPTSVAVTGVGATSANVAWAHTIVDATGFEVEVAPSPFSSWTAVSGSPAAAGALGLALSGLDPVTTYKARVRGVVGASAGAWAQSAEFTTAQVAAVSITITINDATLAIGQAATVTVVDSNLEPVDGAMISTSDAGVVMTAAGETTVTDVNGQATVIGIAGGSATIFADYGDLTDDVAVSVLATSAAPALVWATAVLGTSLTARWTDSSSDETGFDVEIAAFPFVSWSALSGSPVAANTTSLAATGLTLSERYRLRVRAKNANGDSLWTTSQTLIMRPSDTLPTESRRRAPLTVTAGSLMAR